MRKGRLWQIHLSTAILLMFVAGGLLWANFTAYKSSRDSIDLTNWASGWPLPLLRWYSANGEAMEHKSISELGVVFNLSAAALILTGIALICENLIRRRESRKP